MSIKILPGTKIAVDVRFKNTGGSPIYTRWRSFVRQSGTLHQDQFGAWFAPTDDPLAPGAEKVIRIPCVNSEDVSEIGTDWPGGATVDVGIDCDILVAPGGPDGTVLFGIHPVPCDGQNPDHRWGDFFVISEAGADWIQIISATPGVLES